MKNLSVTTTAALVNSSAKKGAKVEMKVKGLKLLRG